MSKKLKAKRTKAKAATAKQVTVKSAPADVPLTDPQHPLHRPVEVQAVQEIVPKVEIAKSVRVQIPSIKTGTKVRVLDMQGRASKCIFTVLPVDDDEPKPGADWYAVSSDVFAHVSDLVVVQ